MLYLVRHGQTVWNRQLRLQGRLDSPLTMWGTELALDYGAYLGAHLPAGALDRGAVAVCSSPLGRAAQTASVLADAVGVGAEGVTCDPLLAEQDVGAWQGLRWDEIESRYGVTRAVLRDWDARPPRGETRREMLERAHRWLEKPRTAEVTIVVSHGGFSRAFRGAYLALEPAEIGRLATHDHGRLFELRDGRVTEHETLTRARPREAALG